MQTEFGVNELNKRTLYAYEESNNAIRKKGSEIIRMCNMSPTIPIILWYRSRQRYARLELQEQQRCNFNLLHTMSPPFVLTVRPFSIEQTLNFWFHYPPPAPGLALCIEPIFAYCAPDRVHSQMKERVRVHVNEVRECAPGSFKRHLNSSRRK